MAPKETSRHGDTLRLGKRYRPLSLLDSAANRPDHEPLTEDEQLAMLIHAGYTDEADMEDLECD